MGNVDANGAQFTTTLLAAHCFSLPSGPWTKKAFNPRLKSARAEEPQKQFSTKKKQIVNVFSIQLFIFHINPLGLLWKLTAGIPYAYTRIRLRWCDECVCSNTRTHVYYEVQ